MRTVLRPLDWVLIAVAVVGVIANFIAVYLSYQGSDWLPVFNAVGSVGLLGCALLMFRAVALRASRRREDESTDPKGR